MSMNTLSLDSSSAIPSSSTLWAQASKEWVIPAKPKPGRKPKKDAAPLKDPQETDAKGRRIQNRAAQRAFRERKQSQLADLQARVQSYEQGQIERNVVLQQLSKRLKEENESLKSENAALKVEVASLKERLSCTSFAPLFNTNDEQDKERRVNVLKRWRDGRSAKPSVTVSTNTGAELIEVSRKKFRNDTLSPMSPVTQMHRELSHNDFYVPCSPSLASTLGSEIVSVSANSALPQNPLSSSTLSSHNHETYTHHESTKSFEAVMSSPPFDSFDCGLCTVATPCICREIALQSVVVTPRIDGALKNCAQDVISTQVSTQTMQRSEEAERQANNMRSGIINMSLDPKIDYPTNMGFQSSKYNASTDLLRHDSLTSLRVDRNDEYKIRPSSSKRTQSQSSVLRSVALPKKPGRPAASSVWQVAPASCTGDPSDCPACKDDDFGKAFCRALGDCVKSGFTPCTSCPNPEVCSKTPNSSDSRASPTVKSTGVINTSGNIMEAQILPVSLNKHHLASSSATNVSLAPFDVRSFHQGSQDKPDVSETIPANEAWARLKSHPNIAFADLSMLAEVVARRTKCSGPATVIDPAPGSVTPERSASPNYSKKAPHTVHAHKLDESRNCAKQSGNQILSSDDAHTEMQIQRSDPSSSSTEAEAPSRPAVNDCPRILTSSGPSQITKITDRPILVPQEELRECGRRRIREVDAAGVSDALRILDAQFGKGS